MKEKKLKDTFELEVVAGAAGGVILLLLAAGIMDNENAETLFTTAIGFGSLLNGLLAAARYMKKSYVLGILFSILSIAMLILFVLQILILKG